jgi:hypothetical protein
MKKVILLPEYFAFLLRKGGKDDCNQWFIARITRYAEAKGILYRVSTENFMFPETKNTSALAASVHETYGDALRGVFQIAYRGDFNVFPVKNYVDLSKIYENVGSTKPMEALSEDEVPSFCPAPGIYTYAHPDEDTGFRIVTIPTRHFGPHHSLLEEVLKNDGKVFYFESMAQHYDYMKELAFEYGSERLLLSMDMVGNDLIQERNSDHRVFEKVDQFISTVMSEATFPAVLDLEIGSDDLDRCFPLTKKLLDAQAGSKAALSTGVTIQD